MSERIKSNEEGEMTVVHRLRIVTAEIEKFIDFSKLERNDRLKYKDLENEERYLRDLQERGITRVDKDSELPAGTKVLLKIKPPDFAKGQKFPNMFVAISGYEEYYTIHRRALEIGPDVYELEQGRRYGEFETVRRHNIWTLDGMPRHQ